LRLQRSLNEQPKDTQRLIERNFLLEFVRQAWKIYRPGVPYLENWHIELICEYLTLVTRGELVRLIINIPSRYSKSALVSTIWPCWEWLTIPSQRWIFVSYAYGLSMQNAYWRRAIIRSAWYQRSWKQSIGINPKHDTVADTMNTSGGQMFSTSTGGTLTGIGGNRIVIDDPTNPRQALSVTQRSDANEWFGHTLSTRLDDKIAGAIVLIQQRIHDSDMTGHLTGLNSSDLNSHLIKANGWTLLRIPVIAEQDEEIVFPISKRVIGRKVGDVLWPEREPLKELEEQKRILDYQFESQYQQRPASRKGQVFDRDWLMYYDTLPPIQPESVMISLDSSFKGTQSSSYVVIQVWARYGPDNYLIDQVRDKMTFTETLDAMEAIIGAYPQAFTKLIEAKANGDAIIEVLKRKYAGIEEANPTTSKEARAIAITPLFRGHNVYFPRQAPWLHDLLTEITLFPTGSWTDQVDAMTQALKYLETMWGKSVEMKRKPLLRLVH
jgi:predicted phage terminase large subunit-like protein